MCWKEKKTTSFESNHVYQQFSEEEISTYKFKFRHRPNLKKKRIKLTSTYKQDISVQKGLMKTRWRQ